MSVGHSGQSFRQSQSMGRPSLSEKDVMPRVQSYSTSPIVKNLRGIYQYEGVLLTEDKVIGRGMFGKIYQLEGHVSNKVVKQVELKPPENDMKSIEKEYSILEQLIGTDPKSAPQVYDIQFSTETVTGRDGRSHSKYAFIVMERVEGKELFQSLREKEIKNLSKPKTPFIDADDGLILSYHSERGRFQRLAMADQLVHQTSATLLRGIAHRDQKTENVMFQHNSRRPEQSMVLQIDYGLAQTKEEIMDKGLRYCGSPFYLSPELHFDIDNGYSQPPFRDKKLESQIKRERWLKAERTEMWSTVMSCYSVLTSSFPNYVKGETKELFQNQSDVFTNKVKRDQFIVKTVDDLDQKNYPKEVGEGYRSFIESYCDLKLLGSDQEKHTMNLKEQFKRLFKLSLAQEKKDLTN